MSEPIPVTEIVTYYQSLRGIPEADRIAEAERHLKAPDKLADMFARSVREFSSFRPAADDPFHPDDDARDKRKFVQSSKTRVFAAALTMLGEEWMEVPGAPELGFRYVDREIVPARAPNARWPAESKPPQVDLLLASQDGNAIVAEAKIGDDMDPFFALIQVLAMSSQLATPEQMRRLGTLYEAIDPEATRVDAYVVTGGTPTGSNWQTFSDSARELAEGLIKCEGLNQHLRRIAAISVELKPSQLYASSG